ncbi:MAG: hypothetical protein LBV54_08185 [Puniceicoccales bacterium]|jgi:hypothetical protein|nr:hypothetical protein [Puniceicoccales bacterium]
MNTAPIPESQPAPALRLPRPRRLAPDLLGSWVYALVVILLALQVVALAVLDIL